MTNDKTKDGKRQQKNTKCHLKRQKLCEIQRQTLPALFQSLAT